MNRAEIIRLFDKARWAIMDCASAAGTSDVGAVWKQLAKWQQEAMREISER